MGKVYKGYELYKMIADREIKKDSKFKDNNNIIWVWDGLDLVTEECDYNDFVFSLIDFELIEDEEINIQQIEEYKTEYTERCIDMEVREKINEIIRAVNKMQQENKKEENIRLEMYDRWHIT